MSDFFFYGTLCHQPLLDVVLGRNALGERAVLPNHTTHWALGQSFPLIVQNPGQEATGLLLRDLSPQEAERLDFYEGAFGYVKTEVTLASGDKALTYFPTLHPWQPGAPWDLKLWAKERGAVVVSAAQDFMDLMGKMAGPDIAKRYQMMLVRAASRLRASHAPQTQRRQAAAHDIQLEAKTTPYANFFAVEEYDFRHRRFDGSYSPLINRAAFVSGDAATVLPYDPQQDLVLLIEQFRTGPYSRGDANPWLLEPVAGRVDPFETPEDCARREAVEEAGVELDDLLAVANYYPSPAAKGEYLYSYVALCDLSKAASQIGGMEDEGEDIRTHILPFPRVMELLETGEINNGPLVLTLYWLQARRDALRAASANHP